MIMKKISGFFLGALIIAALASCAKEEKLFQDNDSAVARTFSCSFEASKTSLLEGKTVWAKGDSVWVSNGRGVEHFGVPEEFDGKKEFKFTSKLGGEIYVVYPLKAVDGEGYGLVDGKLVVNIPSNQDGTFSSANVSVAKTMDETVVMKNATAVLKFTIPDEALIPVKAVILHANGNALTGVCSIDLSTGTPVVTASQTGSDVFVAVEGANDTFYASVVPGTYQEGFSITSITTALQVDSKITTSSNEVKVNEMVDLGNTGTNLKKLEGDGSAANPWQINNLGEMLAFAYHVNAGNNMEGQSIKLLADIDGYSLPVGYYDAITNKYVSFKGSFDGGNKTIKVDINGRNCRTEDNIGLFGIVEEGATIKDLVVAGVVAGADTIGAVAGQVMAGTKGVVVSNVKNKAAVSGGSVVAGLFGYMDADVANMLSIDDCSNEGAVSASGVKVGGLVGWLASAKIKTVNRFVNKGSIQAASCAGGVAGYAYYTQFNDCENSGAVTTTKTNGGNYSWNTIAKDAYSGTGGITGYCQNGSVINSKNSGDVTGYNKTGGISGFHYWSHINLCKNTGTVKTTGAGIAAGIVSWVYIADNNYISNCVNEGKVESAGGWNGGIIGYAVANPSGGKMLYVSNCKNTAVIKGTSNTGGIVGYAFSINSGGNVTLEQCSNTGNIEGSSDSIGGLVGYQYDRTGWSGPKVIGSVNGGNVKGNSKVGGLIGSLEGYAAAKRWEIHNSVNNGTVTSTAVSGYSYAGGLAGFQNGGTNNSCGLYIYNSINNGNVYYSTTGNYPRVGGVAGYVQCGTITNMVNTGKVLRSNGSDPTATQMQNVGSLIGLLSTTSSRTVKINGAYALEGTCSALFGSSSSFNPALNNGREFKADGSIVGDPVVVKEVSYNTVVSSLNAESNQRSAWYDWIDGPKFAKGVGYGVNIGDQGLDLGNGGNI